MKTIIDYSIKHSTYKNLMDEENNFDDSNSIYGKTREFRYKTGFKKITVKYGFHYIKGNHLPYFSITGQTWVKFRQNTWEEESGGCIHEIIAEYFPELKPLLKWHLHDDDGTNMHYFENSGYWFHQIGIEKDAEKHFKSYVQFGLFATDRDLPDGEYLVYWLKTRLPRIQRVFNDDMKKFNIPYITKQEMFEVNKNER